MNTNIDNYLNIDSDTNSLGDRLMRFNTSAEGEVTGLRLPLRVKKFARVRLAILSAVLQLTKERSLAEISVREICEITQVAPATFFNYFPSKEDVLVYYMRLWSIPVILHCRAAAAQGTVLEAIAVVFDFTAREMERYPQMMFEIIAYIAHAKEPPRPLSLSQAERLMAFPDNPDAEHVEPQAIDDLFTTLLKQAVDAGELSSFVSMDTAALLLKTIFYGVPLATRREGVQNIRRAYHEALDVLLSSLKKEERRNANEENKDSRTSAN